MKKIIKLLKHCLYLQVIFCCYADAAPKETISELACPYILPAEKDFPASWVTLGKITADRLQLREMGIIDGNAAEEKQRVLEAKERMFTDDMIDEWETFGDRSESVAEYDETHRENALKCTYGKTQEESFDVNLNVVLLIPLPPKKYVTCLLVRRDIDPTHKISCKVK
ncbi:MAG: hypothetical protein V4660_14345 [Pseudomonadota bacterium]